MPIRGSGVGPILWDRNHSLRCQKPRPEIGGYRHLSAIPEFVTETLLGTLVSEVLELFGSSTARRHEDWKAVVDNQRCPFLDKKCYKVRKSDPDLSIGTCTVLYGTPPEPLLICPARLTDRRQAFADCLHLLARHEPGNELHIVQEVQIPGGNVDYFLVSVKNEKVKDFVGIEIQTLDTTGTVWPARQRVLAELEVPRHDDAEKLTK